MRIIYILALLVVLSGCTQDNPSKLTGNAVAAGDPSICDRIADSRSRYECSLQVAVASDNLTLCTMMQSEEWVQDCVTNISIKRRDMKVCDILESERGRDDCYRGYQSS